MPGEGRCGGYQDVAEGVTGGWMAKNATAGGATVQEKQTPSFFFLSPTPSKRGPAAVIFFQRARAPLTTPAFFPDFPYASPSPDSPNLEKPEIRARVAHAGEQHSISDVSLNRSFFFFFFKRVTRKRDKKKEKRRGGDMI